MRILVSLSGMLRLIALCFVLGIALGVYFGVAGAPDAAPAVHAPVSVDETAP
jgi:hypothetical protein